MDEESQSVKIRVPSVASFSAAPDVKFQWTWLGLSAVVVLLSMMMQISDGKSVTIPFTQIAMPELCTFRRVTGIDCAGCGMTRCFISLGHGDLARAFAYHPAGILLYAMVLFQIPFRTWQLVRIARGKREVHLGRAGYTAVIGFAILMFAQWIVRQSGQLF